MIVIYKFYNRIFIPEFYNIQRPKVLLDPEEILKRNSKKFAQDYPDYDLGGTVEIREVMKFDQ